MSDAPTAQPNEPATPRSIIASALEQHRNGNLDEAAALYRKALELEPKNSDATRLLGVLARQQRKFETASEFLHAAVAFNPKSAEAHQDLALLYFDLRLFSQAERILERAVKLNPSSPDAWHNLGNTRSALWDLDRADACFQQTLQLNPELAETRRSLEGLQVQRRELEDLTSFFTRLQARGLGLQSKRNPDSATVPKLDDRHILPHLLNRIGLVGCGAEIGVQKGRFSEHLLRYWRGTTLYSIDPWRTLASHEYVDVANVSQKEHDRFYADTVRRLKPFKGRSTILRMTSQEAAGQIADRSLDFCYLDGDHSYEAIRQDIELWYPKLREGGLLGGHDFVADGEYEYGSFGVQRAVKEFVAKANLELVVSNELELGSWFVIRRR